MQFRIGTGRITSPNFVGELVNETPKTLTLRVVEIDFTPKTGMSGRFTHTFDTDEREYLTQCFAGRVFKYWKGSHKEIGSDFSYLLDVL